MPANFNNYVATVSRLYKHFNKRTCRSANKSKILRYRIGDDRMPKRKLRAETCWKAKNRKIKEELDELMCLTFDLSSG